MRIGIVEDFDNGNLFVAGNNDRMFWSNWDNGNNHNYYLVLGSINTDDEKIYKALERELNYMVYLYQKRNIEKYDLVQMAKGIVYFVCTLKRCNRKGV